MSFEFSADMRGPTPLVSAISALGLLLIIAANYAAIVLLSRGPGRTTKGTIERLGKLHFPLYFFRRESVALSPSPP